MKAKRGAGREDEGVVAVQEAGAGEVADRSLDRVTLAEIAYLLGYADQSTFFRASHRWFDEAPGEYRARVLGGYQKEIAAARQK